MSNIKANKLDKVRAAAIYNTEKRFREAKEKEAEKSKLEEIATGLTASRQPKAEPKSVEKDK